MITTQNVYNAGTKLQRALNNNNVDPVSGFTTDQIVEWLQIAAAGIDPKSCEIASQDVEVAAQAVLRRNEYLVENIK